MNPQVATTRPRGRRRQRRGYVIFVAIAALLMLMVFSAVFFAYGTHGLRRERAAAAAERGRQISLSMRDYARFHATELCGAAGRAGAPAGPVGIPIDALLPASVPSDAALVVTPAENGAASATYQFRFGEGRSRLSERHTWPLCRQVGAAGL